MLHFEKEGGKWWTRHLRTELRLTLYSEIGNQDTWWVEVGSCAIVLGALFAIFGILYPHQNAPLPNWPYSISINISLHPLALS